MENFKASKLFTRLQKLRLSDSAWDFIDACTDDWMVEETRPTSCGPKSYTITYPAIVYFNGLECTINQTHSGSILAIAAYIEAAALAQTLLMRYQGFGADYE